jgi:hypothetical protein
MDELPYLARQKSNSTHHVRRDRNGDISHDISTQDASTNLLQNHVPYKTHGEAIFLVPSESGCLPAYLGRQVSFWLGGWFHLSFNPFPSQKGWRTACRIQTSWQQQPISSFSHIRSLLRDAPDDPQLTIQADPVAPHRLAQSLAIKLKTWGSHGQ